MTATALPTATRACAPTPPDMAALRQLIPPVLRRPDARRAAAYLLVALAQLVLAGGFALWAWHQSGWWLYPLTWFASGFAFTALFVLGHDCGHYALLRSRRMMDLLGHLLLLPALYPFHAWRYSHAGHHRHTNNLVSREHSVDWDNAWRPLTPRGYRLLRRKAPFTAILYRLGHSLPPLGSLLHNLLLHYRPGLYPPAQRRAVTASIVFVLTALVSGGLAIGTAAGSPWALLHFWLLPAVCFQLWMSAYTYLHHTAEDVAVYGKDEWSPYRGQVLGTVNCYVPRWRSFLHFNIDVHQPHHILTSIPCYHLRAAQRLLKASPYAADFRERRFGWRMLWRQTHACQLWDIGAGRYVSFAEAARRPSAHSTAEAVHEMDR